MAVSKRDLGPTIPRERVKPLITVGGDLVPADTKKKTIVAVRYWWT